MTSGQETERVYSYNPEPARGRGGGILCMICSSHHHSRCVCCVRNGTVIRDARTVSFNDNSTRAALRCADIAARRKRFYEWCLDCIIIVATVKLNDFGRRQNQSYDATGLCACEQKCRHRYGNFSIRISSALLPKQ